MSDNSMLQEVCKKLSKTAKLVPAKDAETEKVPTYSGLYAIFVDKAESFLLIDVTKNLKNSKMIYLGKASSSLKKRLVGQDLRNKGHSTFFRGIGAVLGFTPPKGSLKRKSNKNNYKFSPCDTQKIIDWINEHLSARWIPLRKQQIEAVESAAISELKPLLNTQHNPNKLPELAKLRENCRRIARS